MPPPPAAPGTVTEMAITEFPRYRVASTAQTLSRLTTSTPNDRGTSVVSLVFSLNHQNPHPVARKDEQASRCSIHIMDGTRSCKTRLTESLPILNLFVRCNSPFRKPLQSKAALPGRSFVEKLLQGRFLGRHRRNDTSGNDGDCRTTRSAYLARFCPPSPRIGHVAGRL